MNSPAGSDATTSAENQLTADAGDPRLSLAKKKLAGSERCLNCNTVLKGPFCYHCGQPDRNFLRFFPVLLRDLMEDAIDFDSRFMRTLKPLLFKPGCLTKDFMAGRRFRYTPPMRLYIFSSIVFFLLAALFSSSQVNIDHSAINTAFKLEDISFNGQPWDRQTNPIDIALLPGWINDRLNDEVENSPKKALQITDNPNLLVDKVFDILPATMFVLLPLAALIFKFWYLFAKRYYLEHLIFSLHNHAFIFVCLSMLLVFSATSDWLPGRGLQALATGVDWLMVAIWSWIPLYLLISLRVVYQQGWFLTVVKFVLIGISYITLLGVVSAGVAITSFIML